MAHVGALSPPVAAQRTVMRRFEKRARKTSFQNRASTFQCARTYPAPTEQKCGHKRILGFLCSACSLGARTTRCCCNFGGGGSFQPRFLKSRPPARSKRGPVDHRGPVGNLCNLHAACVIIHAAIPPSTMAGTVASNATAMTATAQNSVPVVSIIFLSSYARSRVLLTGVAIGPRVLVASMSLMAVGA